jgi:RNase P/RNase MRP subunit POP5
MKVKSTLKAHRRYLLIDSLDEQEIEDIILEGIGTIGWAKTDPMFLKSKNNKIILAILRKELDNVRACFAISKKPVKIIKVSGTLKGLE